MKIIKISIWDTVEKTYNCTDEEFGDAINQMIKEDPTIITIFVKLIATLKENELKSLRECSKHVKNICDAIKEMEE